MLEQFLLPRLDGAGWQEVQLEDKDICSILPKKYWTLSMRALHDGLENLGMQHTLDLIRSRF